jgi:glutathione synthase/RimK-type ligase-like ATP-grasp enzyme
MTRVSLVTCARFPGLEDDDQPVIPALAARGIEAVPAIWNDPAVDWASFDLNVVRNPWDYTDHVDDFVAWARRTPRLANPGSVLAWNVDKHYLAEIAAAGVPTIPTTYVGPGDPLPDLPAGEVVVKPTVSAGSRDTLRLDDGAAIVAQIERIRATGRTAMVQPYLAAVDEVGETATIWFHGEHSHAARKAPLLPLGRSLVDGLYAPEVMAPRTATPAELEVGAAALAAVPGGGAAGLLYARVDLIPDAAGTPTVLEIEITEPTLFLTIGEAYERFADAIAATAGR